MPKMNSKVELWTIRQLLAERNQIDLNPAYQRGPAWRPDKQELLLDSIFRNYDLPKIYFSKSTSSNHSRYEVIDGQQRVRAILDFAENKLAIPGDIVGRPDNEKVLCLDLNDTELANFESFSLTVTLIEGARPMFKRTLFERLQLGERLNPAELRNALPSSAPRDLRAIAINHKFFKVAGIRDSRYKRDDYLTHIFAYVHYIKKSELKDIKAPSLRKYVLEAKRGLNLDDMRAIDDALNFFSDVAKFEQKVFRNKWSFVDSMIFYLSSISKTPSLDAKTFGKALSKIEGFRKENLKNQHILLSPSCRTPNKELLYEYINCYKAGAALKDSLETRQKYLNASIISP